MTERTPAYSESEFVVESCSRFSCSQCGKTFTFRHEMRRHKKNKHENLRFSCDVCASEFCSMSNLNRHKVMCQRPRTTGYNCTRCNKVLSSTSGLERHKSQQHSDGEKRITCLPYGNKCHYRKQLAYHKKTSLPRV